MSICSDCKYNRTCGDSSRTEPCEGKVKFARSTPDKFGYIEYCVETSAPYEFVRCKNRTKARREVQNFKKQGRTAVVIVLTPKGNDYIIKL